MQNHTHVAQETSEIKEPTTSAENNQSQSRLSQPEDTSLVEDSEDLNLGMNWGASSNYQTRFTKWVMQEKRRRQVENKMLTLHWKRLKEERQRFETRKKEFEEAEADLAQDVKDLIPIAAELKQMGFDFSTANSWLICIKEMSQRKGLDIKSAGYKLADDLKNFQELELFETAIKNAEHQLSLLQMAQEDRKEEIAYFADLRKSGIAKREIMELMNMVNSKINGNGFKLDREMNLSIGEGQ